MNFFKKYSTFHKIYFLVFFCFNIFTFGLELYNEKTFTTGIVIVLIASIISTISGLFAGIYTARAEVAAYTWGIINTCFYIFISITNHMYAEVILYVIYMLPMNIYGYFAWKKSARESRHDNTTESTIEVRSLSKKQIGLIVPGVLILWGLYALFIYNLPNILQPILGFRIPEDHLFYIDSFTATVTIFAVIVSTKRFKETWYFWILSDGVGAILYFTSLFTKTSFSFSSLSGAMMWIQYVTNAVYGVMMWKKLNKVEHEDKGLNDSGKTA